jgi:hypothetical protein
MTPIIPEMTPIERFLFDLEFLMDFGGDNDYFDKKLHGFWCDGIRSPYDAEEFKKIVDNNGFIELPMDFGKSGQDPYKLVLHFGKKARLKNAQKQYERECVPDFSKEPDSILIDEENNIVQVYLK